MNITENTEKFKKFVLEGICPICETAKVHQKVLGLKWAGLCVKNVILKLPVTGNYNLGF